MFFLFKHRFKVCSNKTINHDYSHGLNPKKFVFHPPRARAIRASKTEPIFKQYQREIKGTLSGIVRYFCWNSTPVITPIIRSIRPLASVSRKNVK